jgi:hypothetical protein
MESGNKKHRYSYSGGIKALEESKHGRATAFKRYGKPEHYTGAPRPKDESGPQFRGDQRSDKNFNDVSEKSWLRGAGESGKPKR